MDPILAIRERFEAREHVKFEEGDGWIRYVPEADGGFAVEFRYAEDGFVVSIDEWREKFTEGTTALNHFAFGLSDQCRVKIVTKARKPIRREVQAQRDGKWAVVYERRSRIYQYWRLARVRYLQNKGL